MRFLMLLNLRPFPDSRKGRLKTVFDFSRIPSPSLKARLAPGRVHSQLQNWGFEWNYINSKRRDLLIGFVVGLRFSSGPGFAKSATQNVTQ